MLLPVTMCYVLGFDRGVLYVLQFAEQLGIGLFVGRPHDVRPRSDTESVTFLLSSRKAIGTGLAGSDRG